jgi:hypothetical protein
MATQNAIITVTKNTTANTPVKTTVNLAQPFIRAIHVRSQFIANANIGEIFFRITNQNAILAPYPGTGLSQWINPMNGIDWEEFKRLQGPNYEVVIESYNIDASNDCILQVTFELSLENFYPVNIKDFVEKLTRDPLKFPTEGF